MSPLPWAEPFAAALALRHEPGLVLLESMPGFGHLGRRSYLAARPAEVATDGLGALDRLGDGWWAGWLSYDLGREIERLPDLGRDDLGLPPLALGRFEAWIEFDHERRHRRDPRRRRRRASRAGAAQRRRRAAGARADRAVAHVAAASGLRGRRAARDRLHQGRRRLPGEPLAAPQRASGAAIRSRCTRGCARESPAPYAALVRLGGADVISASPERFLSRRGDAIETRPIKGTRARATPMPPPTAAWRWRCAPARRTSPRT